jgi:hypothetical protein
MKNNLSVDDLPTERNEHPPVALPLSFSLAQITQYCIDCVEWKDAQPIVNMSNKLMRNKATQEEYDLLDKVEKDFKQRSQNIFQNPVITMEKPHIQGPIYEIKDNNSINLQSDGRFEIEQ